MVRYLLALHFFILLFAVVALWLCSTLCVAGAAASGGGEKEPKGELFKPGVIEGVKGSDGAGAPQKITLSKLSLPFFLFAVKDSVMAAVVKAEYTEEPNSGGNKVNVLAKFIDTKDKDSWKEGSIEDAIKTWTTQFVTKNNGQENALSTLIGPIVNADKNKVYIFLVNINSNQLEFKLGDGTITTEGSSHTIKWNPESSIQLEDTEKKLNEYKITSFAAEGSVFLVENKRILFVVKGVCEKSEKKNVTLLFQYQEETGNKLVLLHHGSTTGLHPSFFQWNGKIFKTPTDNSNDGSKDVMVFDANEQTKFKKSKSSIVCLRDFFKDKRNFATATIGEENKVLLFTQEKPHSGTSNGESDAHLWMYDGTRVGHVGIIASNFKGAFYGSLLHTNKGLFAIYQTYETGDSSLAENNKIYFIVLKKRLERITETLTSWKDNGVKVKELYKDTVIATVSSFTDGLVGLLSDTNGGTIKWTDQYLNVDAVVTENDTKKTTTKLTNGFTFSGEGAGAKWPVDQENKDQPYNFMEFGFTLVATVTVGSSAISDKNSILGVGLSGNANVGLWCTANDKWGVSGENGKTDELTSVVNCTHNKKYYVALILKNKSTISVYVDGIQLTTLNNQPINTEIKKDITHFYFGSDKDKPANTDVTIESVLLYNKPFDDGIIQQLKLKQNTVAPTQAVSENDSFDKQTPKEATDKTGTQPDTSVTQTTTEKETQPSSPPPTTEDSAARVGVVGVLCFMLFGVFTLLGRYVY